METVFSVKLSTMLLDQEADFQISKEERVSDTTFLPPGSPHNQRKA